MVIEEAIHTEIANIRERIFEVEMVMQGGVTEKDGIILADALFQAYLDLEACLAYFALNKLV
jgi:hypothetical protein